MGDDGLDLSVGLQSVGSQLASESRLVVTAEGGHGGEDVVAVHPV